MAIDFDMQFMILVHVKEGRISEYSHVDYGCRPPSIILPVGSNTIRLHDYAVND